MRVIFMGTPDFSVPALEAVAARHEVVAVYSQPPRPAGRGKALRPSPVQARAEALGLPVRHPVSLKGAEAQAEFAALGADVAVVVAYGLILPQAVLDAPRFGCLNIHASLLPRWRGAAPIHGRSWPAMPKPASASCRWRRAWTPGRCWPAGRCDRGRGDHGRTARPAERPGCGDDRRGAGGAAVAGRAAVRGRRDLCRQDRQGRGAGGLDAPGLRGGPPDPRLVALSRRLDRGGGRAGETSALARCAGAGVPGQVLGGFTIACGAGAVQVLEAQREGKRPMPADEVLKGLSLPDRLA